MPIAQVILASLFVILLDFRCFCKAECRHLTFDPRIENKVLTGHVIKTLNATSDDNCMITCYFEKRCVSYNLGPFQAGFHVCQLSNSSRVLHEDDLRTKQGYVFHPARNPCNKNPCPEMNTTCLAGFTKKGYRCHCILQGFTGERCEEDVDECKDNLHNCSSDRICNNTRGSFTCVCKSGFENGEKCLAVKKNCTEIRNAMKTESGVYAIDPDGQGPFKVYCEQDLQGGGFAVFQRRLDGSVDFYRDWDEYKNGFGDLEGEFWLGLEKIHRLTNETNKLVVTLKDWDGNDADAVYDGFKIDGEDNKYTITVSNFSGGSAGDSLIGSSRLHNGMAFSTKDRDNDKVDDASCSQKHKGAWWYSACYSSNLNGVYHQGGVHSSNVDGINWESWKGYQYSAKESRMMIRPL